VYPISVVPNQAHIAGMAIPLGTIYRLNPLVQLIECYRDAMYDLRFPPLIAVLYLIAWSVALVGIGLVVFQKLDHRLAEEV
jgi:ABC-type polysaccharide/polyol phosphate export permease